MRYVTARYTQYQREMTYRIYVSECLRILTGNTAKMGGGSFMNKSLSEILYSKPKIDKSCDEIVQDLANQMGLEVID